MAHSYSEKNYLKFKSNGMLYVLSGTLEGNLNFEFVSFLLQEKNKFDEISKERYPRSIR